MFQQLYIPETALKAVRTGMMGLMLFSIKPVYDMLLEDMLRDVIFSLNL